MYRYFWWLKKRIWSYSIYTILLIWAYPYIIEWYFGVCIILCMSPASAGFHRF